MSDQPRTTNNVEAWHRVFQQTVDAHHPSIYKFFEKVRLEQNHHEIQIARLNAGAPPGKRRPEYDELDERLRRIVGAYDPNNRVEFMKNIAKNLDFNF